MTVGKHNVQARAYITNNGTNYYSTTLYFDFVVKPANGAWESNVTYVLLGLSLDNPTVSSPQLSIKQYQTLEYRAATFDNRDRELNLTISDNGAPIKTVSSQSG